MIDWPRLWGLVAAALALLGSLKVLVEVLLGGEFTVQQLAFDIGVGAFGLFVGMSLAGVPLRLIEAAALKLRGRDREADWSPLFTTALVIGGLLVAAPLTLLNSWFSYADQTVVSRAFWGLVGVGVLTTAVYLWRRHRPQE